MGLVMPSGPDKEHSSSSKLSSGHMRPLYSLIAAPCSHAGTLIMCQINWTKLQYCVDAASSSSSSSTGQWQTLNSTMLLMSPVLFNTEPTGENGHTSRQSLRSHLLQNLDAVRTSGQILATAVQSYPTTVCNCQMDTACLCKQHDIV